MEVQFHRLAAEEYRAARRRYESRVPGLGGRFRDELNRAVERIAAAPDRWPRYRELYHRHRVRRFPYTLFYRISRVQDEDTVIVLAVAHTRRREGYWMRRAT